MGKVLVTGANGYIGKAVCRKLVEMGYLVRGTVRTQNKVKELPTGVEAWITGNIDEYSGWHEILDGVDRVVHTAGRVHVKEKPTEHSLEVFRNVNVIATKNLAEAAAAMNIKSFVFLSTVAVYGKDSTEEPISVDSPINPVTFYGQTKWEAEKNLQEIFRKNSTKLTILRPAMVYGKGAPGNFALIEKIVQKGIPIPLGSVKNKRHFTHIDVLVDKIISSLFEVNDGKQIWLVADENSLSTKDLFNTAGQWYGKRVCIFPVPAQALRTIFYLFGAKKVWEKLAGNYELQPPFISNFD